MASLLLLCKQGNVFCLFFQEQLNKKNNMLSFNAILNQSRATQSQKKSPALLVLVALANVRPSFISLFAYSSSFE